MNTIPLRLAKVPPSKGNGSVETLVRLVPIPSLHLGNHITTIECFVSISGLISGYQALKLSKNNGTAI